MERKTMKETHQSISQRDQAYGVTINTVAFQYKNAPIKERAQRELIPQYWNKFKMDQKIILPSKEDRLSQLTTKQIDRIIDMQKIRSLLYNKKRKLNDQYVQSQQKNPNSHTNVYQANFLAAVNQIAIQRNIKHEASEDFDQFIQTQLAQNKKSQKMIAVPYKFTKEYTLRGKLSLQNHIRVSQEQLEKSIDSIEVDLDAFQLSLQEKRKATINHQKNKQQSNQSKLLHPRRWFYGMSTFYINQAKKQLKYEQSELYRADYDIESEMNGNKEIKKNSAFRRTSISLFSNKKVQPNNKNKREAFDKFKTSRLVTIG